MPSTRKRFPDFSFPSMKEPVMTDLETTSRLSAAAVGRALHAGEVCPVGLAEAALEKIDAGAVPHAFIVLTRERALAQARAAKARIAAWRPASALDGVPVGIKDLIDIEGEVTTAGSELLRDAAPAAADAPLAAGLDRAGMVFVGKTNLTEFAFSGLGLNPHYGTPHNPHDRSTPRVPGGSSSGSAVAVAAGIVPCAIGSDTGGSVRVPSAFNGLTGYKSSEGRIDKGGVVPLSVTLDTIGPLARSVEDCVLLDMAMRGAAVSPVVRRDVGELRVFVPETFVLDDLDDAVGANFERSVAALSAAGARVERGECAIFTEIGEITAAHGGLSSAEAYTTYRAYLEGPEAARMDRRVVSRMMVGKGMSALDVLTVQQARARLARDLAALLDGRLMLMPTTPNTAPEIAPLEADDAVFHRVNLRGLRNTLMGNFLDTPGVAMPNGTDANGMPTSILLSGVAGADEAVLGFAYAVERVLAEGQARRLVRE